MAIAERLNKIQQGDCVELLRAMPKQSVDLVFADPPFNIGYEYDVYHDKKDHPDYLEWSRSWIAAVHRVLKPAGTFWLAIGDEYAAELKLVSQKVGFTCRSWVIWYYTFGVNCKQKFSRSHAHLFYFVKDPQAFTFRADVLENRIPSARQLVYADNRANPQGRLPDDTWVLRPQDLADCFTAAEDTWYFPRVAGTFKERAGFHGCQMPEQLLGRIIRLCSNEGDVVVDPFSGSATTLVVAKKLGRRFLGCELSADYVKRGRDRLAGVCLGDPLDGAAEPTVSAPSTADGKTVKGLARKSGKAAKESGQSAANGEKAGTVPIFSQRSEEKMGLSPSRGKPRLKSLSPGGRGQGEGENSPSDSTASKSLPAPSPVEALSDPQRKTFYSGLLEAYTGSYEGYSLDRVVADPDFNSRLCDTCRQLGLPGDPRTWNLTLFRMRKAGLLAHLATPHRTEFKWEDCDAFLFASEIAWRQMGDQGYESLDGILCDPTLAAEFDTIAARWAPGFRPLEYRWAALKLRKKSKTVRTRAKTLADATLGRAVSLDSPQKFPAQPGVYVILGTDKRPLYAGEASDLCRRMHYIAEEFSAPWRQLSDTLSARLFRTEPACETRLGYQHRLIQRHEPKLNLIDAKGE